MRILTVGHSYVVSMNRRLAREWALEGHDVTVAAPDFYHADLRPMHCETGENEPFELVKIPALGTRRVHIFRYGHNLCDILKNGRFDVVHAWEEPFIYAGFQIARWSPVDSALIYSTFQNLPKRYPPPFSWFERYSLRKSSGWTGFGQTIVDNLKLRKYYRDKPWVEIPVGVDTGIFRPDQESKPLEFQKLNWPQDDVPVMGYVGRFVEEKGLRHLMKVMDQIQGPGNRWRAIFVGGGPLEQELRDWAGKYGDGVVKILTGVAHDQIPKMLDMLDICVVPSRTMPHWQEQLGRILIEAMASGVPVVASRSGEIPFVLGPGGIILTEDSVEEWVRTLNDLLDQPNLRAKMASRGLARVHQKFEWREVGRQFIDFFESVSDHS
jgi:glycosyltransferase involved in cell wall biosynthesis